MAQQPTVAILGLGGMGHGMAASVLRAGLPTIVWNRRPEPARKLAEQGAEVAGTPADAARQADVVVTMVTDADAVVSIAADQGMLAAMAPNAIWAQMSTIGVPGIERVAAMVDEQRPDVTLLDAPVAGTRGPAEQGNLVIFASGPEEARPRVAPMFDAMGQRTVWVGPVGYGSRVKLVNNTLLTFLAEGVAESIAFGRSLGLSTETLLDVLEGSPLVSPWVSQKLRRIGQDEYSAEYPLALALKDLKLILGQADGNRFAGAQAIAAEWQQATERGFGNDDVTVMARALQQ